MPTKSVSTQIIEKLEDLGDKQFSEDSLTFKGNELIIPSRMSGRTAIETIQNHLEAENTVHRFNRQFRYRPWDVAAAVSRSIKKLTGTSGVGQPTFSFWGATPPSMLTIDVGVGETLQIPQGNIEVALFEGIVSMSQVYVEDYGNLGYIEVQAKRKYRAAIEGWFRLIETELETGSIYRGKAFNGGDVPEFIDLETVDPDSVIYTDEVQFQLEANVWSLMRHTDEMRLNRIPLKRAILLHGPYGTGKTLAAFLTAREAVANSWTFLYCRPAKDDLETVLQTAKLYQPAVVFFEDVDTISGGESVTELLDAFDGITAKGTELIAILTTNHPDRIHKGMVRPGRLDSVIEIGALDRGSFQRMIESSIWEEGLGDIDYDAVAEAMEGMLPAFVKEAIERTKLYALTRGEGKLGTLETADFVHAALGLKPQLDMMNEATEGKARPSLDQAVTDNVSKAVEEAVVGMRMLDSDGDYTVGVMAKNNGR